MELVPYNPQQAGTPVGQVRPEVLDPTMGETFSSAFRQFNGTTALINYMNRPIFPVDKNFDIFAATKDDPLLGSYSDRIARAQSQPELDSIRGRINGELRDWQISASSGWAGTVANLAAGVLDPTILLPLVGEAQGVKGLLQTFALAAAASTTQEAAIYGMHETATLEEAAIGVAAGTVIGGLLGSAAKYLLPHDAARVAFDMADKTDEGTILRTLSDGSLEEIKLNSVPHPETPPLFVREMKRVNSGEGPMGSMGANYLRGTTPEGITVGFVKATGGTKYFIDGEYSIALLDKAGKEISIPGHVDSHLLAGATGMYKQAELKAAFASGDLDKQIQQMLEAADPVLAAEYAKVPSAGGVGLSAQVTPQRVAGKIKRADTIVGKLIDRPITKLEAIDPLTPAGKLAKRVGVSVAKGVTDPLGMLAKINPVTRMMDSNIPVVRYIVGLIHAPLKIKGGSVAGVGAAFDRKGVHDYLIASFLGKYNKSYLDYVSDGRASGDLGQKWLMQLRMNVNMLPDGKLGWLDFGKAVFASANTGATHAEPMVQQAVKDSLDYYKSMQKVADEYHAERVAIDGESASSLYEKLEFSEGGDIQNYFSHQFHPVFLAENSTQFLHDFGNHAEKLATGRFESHHQKVKGLVDGLTALERVLKLDEAGLTAQAGMNILERDAINAKYAPMLQGVKDLRKMLVAANTPKPEIKARVAELEERFGPEYSMAMARKKGIVKEISLLQKVGAGLSEKQTTVLDKIDATEAMQLTTLDRVAQFGADANTELNKLLDNADASDGHFMALWKRFSAAHAQVLRNDKRLVKLADNPELHDKLVDKQIAVTTRMESLQRRIDDFQPEDIGDAKALLDEARATYLERANDLNSKRAVRIERLKERAKELDPTVRAEYRDAELLAAGEKKAELINNFEQRWTDEGATQVNYHTGAADFKPQSLRDAEELYLNLVGNPNRASGMQVIGGKRGPQLRRVLNLPFDIKKKWLVQDPEQVIRSHSHTMLPDMELYRISGSVNGAMFYDEIKQANMDALQTLATYTHMLKGKPVSLGELSVADAAKAVPLTAADRVRMNLKINKEFKNALDDLDVIISRMRHQRGVPANPDGFFYRFGRIVQNLGATTKLGMVVPSSLNDLARPVFLKGIYGTFNDVWKPLLTDMASIKGTNAELRRAGTMNEVEMHTRSAAITDVGENYSVHQTAPERWLEKMAKNMGRIALFDAYTDMSKARAGRASISELSNALHVIHELGPQAKGYKKAVELIDAANLSPNTARNIWEQYKLPGGSTEFNDGFRLPNTESWNSFSDVMALRSAINKMTTDQIITPGLDRPSWMDENMAFKIVAMFRSYTFTATVRILMSGLQKPDMVLMQGAMSSIALGAVSYYTSAYIAGGTTWEKARQLDMQDLIYQGLARSGLLGALGEGQRIGEQVPWLNDYAAFGGKDTSVRNTGSIAEAIIGPAAGMYKNAETAFFGITDPTRATQRAMGNLIPLNQVFYWRGMFDYMETSLGDMLGLPDRRGN